MFRPGNLPRGVPEVDDGGARRDQELEGETRNTQFRQVQAAMCVIPYVMYVVCSLFDCMIVWRGSLPRFILHGGRVTSRLEYRSTSRVRLGVVHGRVRCKLSYSSTDPVSPCRVRRLAPWSTCQSSRGM